MSDNPIINAWESATMADRMGMIQYLKNEYAENFNHQVEEEADASIQSDIKG